MPIRPATPSDEPAMASILASAFFDEPLFGPVIHPHRNKYPEDVKIYWSEWLRKSWMTASERLLVATITVDGIETIAGVAIWERQGDDEGKKKVEDQWADVGEQNYSLPTYAFRTTLWFHTYM